MNRNSLLEMGSRAMHQAVRMTISKVSDNPMWQELDFAGMAGGDIRSAVERIQAFGFTSTPLGPSKKSGGQGQGGQGGIGSQSVGAETRAGEAGGGGAGGGEGGGGAAAEGIALFLGGQRNHPVVIAVDDRRHRPMGLKPGENAQYDDAHQMTLMRRNGLYLLSNDNEDGEGNKAERMVSLRHVEKKKQERQVNTAGTGGQGGGGAGAGSQMRYRPSQRAATSPTRGQPKDQSSYKHEGETVNLELRVTKKKVEYRNGDEVVASHDKATKKWDYKGKEFNVTSEDNANINPGKNTNITSPTTNITSPTGINITGPTSVNGSPAATTAMFIPRDALIAALEARIAALEARLDGA